MKKARNLLTVEEVVELHKQLEHELGQLSMATQPAVATRILELTNDPDAGMANYANVIRHDAALSGRLLRLANSAFFAQRKPITTIDRACVLLGMGRLKSISLGFYLAHAVTSGSACRVSQEVWSQSVYRACFASQLAQVICPQVASEAFLIGLMLDAAIPLVYKIVGPPFEDLYLENVSPVKLFSTEFERHPFTHVDLIGVLLGKWNFPALLTKPIEWHHTPPSPEVCDDSVAQLHRVAYFAGSLSLKPSGTPEQDVSMQAAAQMHLEIDAAQLHEIIRKANDEYRLVIDFFSGVTDGIGEAERLAEHVHNQLIDIIDGQIAMDLADTTRPKPQHFKLGGLTVLLRPEDGGAGTAFAYDSAGDPLSTYRFLFTDETASSIREALGLEQDSGDDIEAVADYLEKLAA